jgi:CRISPR-associated protein Cmr2
MEKVLFAGDVDRTQSYVFESSRLPEIRGASRMLDDAGDEAERAIQQSGGELIFQGGGSLLALLDLPQAAALSEKIETIFLRKTHTATITTAWRPVSEQLLTQGLPGVQASFGSLMDWASIWLRREKDGRTASPWLESPSHAERCRSCHVRPVAVETLDKYPDWPLCSVCQSKRTYKGRDLWFREFQDFLDKNPNLHTNYYNNLEPFPQFDARQSLARWTPQDLDEIGQCCRTQPGYVGLIYLDGDNMGQLFSGLVNRADARLLSQAIHEAARQAVFTALAGLSPVKVIPSQARKISGEYPAGGEALFIHPFEIITIGGDDLLLIVPADHAVAIAAEVSQAFPKLLMRALNEKKASQGLLEALRRSPPSLSGGVVLASDHNPIHVLWSRARELKTSAKKARHAQKAAEGYIDFSILLGTEIPDRDLKAERARYPYTIQLPGKSPLSLLKRPYPAGKLGAAWVQLRKLRASDFANSQMSQLAGELLHGQAHSRQYYLYQRARITSIQKLDSVVETLQGPLDEVTYPWFEFQKSPGQPFSAVTALWDIAELFPFAPEKGG